MSKKIENMKMSQLVKEIGTLSPLIYNCLDNKHHMYRESDFNEVKMAGKIVNTTQALRPTYKREANFDRAIEFEKKLRSLQIKGFSDDYREFLELMDEYEDIFDKSLYALYMGIELKQDIEKEHINNGLGRNRVFFLDEDPYYAKFFSKNSKKTISKSVVLGKIKGLLKFDDALLVTVYRDSNTKPISYTMDCKSSLDLIGQGHIIEKRDKKGKKKIEQIEEKVGLKKALFQITPIDLLCFSRYKSLAYNLTSYLYRYYYEEKENNVFGPPSYIDDFPGISYDLNEFAEKIKEYVAYLDLDKMLTLSAYKQLQYVENKYGSPDYDEYQDCKKYINQLEGLIDNPNTIIHYEVDDNHFVEVSFNDIKEDIKVIDQHIIGKKFYSNDQIDDLSKKIISGEIPIFLLNKEEFQNTLRFSEQQFSDLVKNIPDSLKFLLENEWINDEQFKKIIEGKTDFTDEQVLYLKESGRLNFDSILELYNQGKISLKNFKFLQSNLESEDISTIVSSKRLVELYLDKSKKEEFDKYRKLYKMLKIDETEEEKKLKQQAKSEEELKQIQSRIIARHRKIGNEILEQSEDLLEEERMFELYRYGLLNFDTVIDYVGVPALNKLYISNEIKPIDARRLYDDGILSQDMIKDILTDPSIEETKKLTLIYSTFPSTDLEDRQIRDELIKCMKNPVENNISSSNHKKRDKDVVIHSTSNKSVTDPCARWNLISKLDKEYIQEYLTDGTMIFYLPNKEKYIIEKLYTSKQDFAYGAATYILDEKLFSKMRDKIIVDKKVNRSFLVQLNKDETNNVKKVVHTGWGKAIGKFFDIDNPELYTEEEKEEIKKLALEVEKSKKPILSEK